MPVEPTDMPGRADGRGESATQRADRNWGELLQELRVAQTGVQLLTAFLLSLPFQQRFASATGFQKGTYLATLLLSVTSTLLLVAPVPLHRLLFRRHLKPEIVDVAERLALGGLAGLGLALTGVVLLILDVVAGTPAAVAVAALTLAAVTGLWLALPAAALARARRDGSLRER